MNWVGVEQLYVQQITDCILIPYDPSQSQQIMLAYFFKYLCFLHIFFQTLVTALTPRRPSSRSYSNNQLICKKLSLFFLQVAADIEMSRHLTYELKTEFFWPQQQSVQSHAGNKVSIRITWGQPKKMVVPDAGTYMCRTDMLCNWFRLKVSGLNKGPWITIRLKKV